MHNKDVLRDIKKLGYFRDEVKDSPAKHVIEELSEMAGSYMEAIDRLQ